jgi:lipopolysaccharide transport system permease protein
VVSKVQKVFLNKHMQKTIYTPQKNISITSLFFEIFNGLKKGNQLAYRFFIRDLKASYEKSILGYFWIFIPPLVTSVIWILLNANNIIQVNDVPMRYSAYCLTGSMIWGIFAESVLKPLQRYKSSMGIMVKLNFPREAVVLASVYDLVWGILIRLVILVPLLYFLGYNPGIHTFYAFLSMVIVSFIGLSIGLVITPLGLLFNDVSRIITMGLPLLMYLSPVLYPISGRVFFARFMNFNPIASWLEFTRSFLGSYHYTNSFNLVFWIFLGLIMFLLSMVLLKITLPIIVERSGS